MKIYVVKDYDAVSKQAAEIISDQIKEKQNSVLGLATGSSPIGIYKLLVEKLLNENDIEKRKTFENIFSLTFLECIKHIRGEINIYIGKKYYYNLYQY